MAIRDINKWMARTEKSTALGYGLAFASVLGALLLEFLFQYLHAPHPFAAFALSAIAITFWYGGTKPGIVAVLLALVIRDICSNPKSAAWPAHFIICDFWRADELVAEEAQRVGNQSRGPHRRTEDDKH